MFHVSLVRPLARLGAILALCSAFVLLIGSLAFPSANAANLLPVNQILNADGTLDLAAAPNGAFDLRGWNVTLDALRGPILAPARSGNARPAYAVGDWSALGSNGADDGALTSIVYALAVSGTDVYVGGIFTDVNNNGTVLPEADYVAKWDGTNWSALGSNGAGNGALNSIVYALAVSGTNLYVGGFFENVNNNGTVLGEADFIAKWDGTNWSALGSDGAGNGSLNNGVHALAVSATDLYVGGQFQNVNNNGTVLGAADRIAKWNGTNWSALGSNGAGNGALNNIVLALAVSGTDVYVGGNFINVNNNGTVLPEADYIAKWDGTNWSALGSNGAGNGSLGNTVNALAVSGTDVYVGGTFTDVNNNGTVLGAADFIARWDGTNWSALSSNGAGNGSLNSLVFALAVSGTDLYVGGWFGNVNDNGTVLGAADRIAKWDGTKWSALGSNGAGNGSLNTDVYALAVSSTHLYAGGEFTDVNNNGTVLSAADYVARFEIASTTASDLAAFHARVNTQQVVLLKWATLDESQIAGFNVYRRVGKKEWRQINAQFIQARHAGTTSSASYKFRDKRVRQGKRYAYKIEIVSTDGGNGWSGTKRVKIQ